MIRCLKFRPAPRTMAAALLLTSSASLIAPAAWAQQAGTRPFPADARRGALVVTEPPVVLLNGRPDHLAPGARIRDAQNLLALSGSLVGQKLLVNYQRDDNGQIKQIWILTPAEARLPQRTPAQ